jgi:3-hydroxybutyryl-CoA dehydrogenase
MGRGIAQIAAAAGYAVCLYDVDAAVAEAAVAAVAASLGRRVDAGKLAPSDRDDTLGRLRSQADLGAACAPASVVIEAIPEVMDLKVRVLSEAARAAPPDALLGSNTSSLSITELGQRLGLGARVLGTHFFNPPPAMPLLELVLGLHTTRATLERGRALAARLGKTAIEVHDSPGFATSRLGVALGAEAIRMLESGVASVQDIDRAMELGYRHPMGPLKLSDLVGLDVRLAILEHLHRELGEQFRPPALLRQMVRAGWVGKKVGRGFYTWTDDGPLPADPRSR